MTDEAVADALFEGGCGDALFGQRDSIQYAELDRAAPSLAADRRAPLCPPADVR